MKCSTPTSKFANREQDLQFERLRGFLEQEQKVEADWEPRPSVGIDVLQVVWAELHVTRAERDALQARVRALEDQLSPSRKEFLEDAERTDRYAG